ncbi:MAG: protein kinase [Planctomycetota bacterium]
MPVPSTAEQLAQSAVDVGVVTDAQLQSVWSDVGGGGASLDEFSQAMMRKGLVTNYQLERLQKGFRDGYSYGDYTVLYSVGAGTFARVFRAVNRKTKEIHALKVLRSRHAGTQKADFFRREGELGKRLKHPNIVPIHEVVSRGPLNYFVMDFVEGQNLRDLYRVRKKFTWQDAAGVLTGTLAGLHYAFGEGATHRDLKMTNVLVASDGTAMLVDFGLAALDGVAPEDAGVSRTVEYAALEKATGVRKDDTRSDVFFAGCMLHQMLTGVASLPEGRNRGNAFTRDTFTSIKPVLELEPTTPMPIAMVLAKALELDPDKRFQTPGDMLNELKLAVRRAEGASGPAKRELASQEGIGPDGKPRRLLLVESDTKRQDVMRDLFKRNGYRVLVATSGERALDRFTADPSAADVVVFCAAKLGAEVVQAFNQMGEDSVTKEKPAVLLLEETQGSWVESASFGAHRGVVVMPIKLRQLREAVLLALNAGQAAEA